MTGLVYELGLLSNDNCLDLQTQLDCGSQTSRRRGGRDSINP